MTDKTNKCSVNETAICCCVDVGTVLDNTDCSASWRGQFASEQEAKTMLNILTEKAQAVASEPCDIRSQILAQEEGVELGVDFTFSCQAEAMIFQLGLR
ncbi:YfcZ/YiiS family protein [Enterobacteriaceae bacterium LUAb1]